MGVRDSETTDSYGNEIYTYISGYTCERCGRYIITSYPVYLYDEDTAYDGSFGSDYGEKYEAEDVTVSKVVYEYALELQALAEGGADLGYVVLYGVTTATDNGGTYTYSTAYYLTLDDVEIDQETDTVTIYVGFEYTYEYGYTYATGEVDGETGEAVTATARMLSEKRHASRGTSFSYGSPSPSFR